MKKKTTKAKTNGKAVIMPPPRHHKKYPFADMKKGDRVVVPGDHHRIISAAHMYGRRNNKKFFTRSTPNGRLYVFRVA